MPINGLTGSVRTLRTAKLKLGYTEKGKKFPSDKDVFIGKVADGVTEEMIAAYGARQLLDAKDPGVYSFGRELRGMLAFEYDAVYEGHEVALELLNRSWATSRIRCSGTGGDEDNPGEAFVRSEQYAAVLRQRGLLHGERKGGWTATCRGRDCPLWYERSEENKLAGCHREMRLHFILLHPTRDEDDPSYNQQLGWIEVASGSWNGSIDVQSGFAAIRALAGGRTALIPFRLRRVMRSVSAPNGRVNKATLLVDHWADEVLTFAMGPPGRALLRPALRQQLAELAAAEASWAALPPVTYDRVADIQPQPDRRALPAHRPPPSPTPSDRDEVIDSGAEPARTPDAATEAPVVACLNQEGRDELKRLCGGVEDVNGRFSGLERFRELVKASYEALGVPRNPPGDLEFIPFAEVPQSDRGALEFLTTAHAAWIVNELREASADRDPDDAPLPVAQGVLLDERAP